MPLKKKVAVIPFGKGVQSKKTDITLEAGELEVLENGIFDKLGHIAKRKGHSESAWSISSVGKPQAFFQFQGAIYWLTSMGSVYRLNPNDLTSFDYLGAYSPVHTETFTASGESALHHQENPHIALSGNGNYLCVVYTEADYDYTNNAINYKYRWVAVDTATMKIVDTKSGRTADALARYTFNGRVKVAAVGNTHFAIYWEYNNGGSYELRRDEMVPNSTGQQPSFASGGVVIAASSNDYNQTPAQQSFDISETASIGSVHVAYYKTNSGSHSVRYVKDNAPLDNTSSADLDYGTDFNGGLSGTAPVSPLAIGRSALGAERIYIGYRTDSSSTIRVYLFPEGVASSTALTATDYHSSSHFIPHGFVDYRPTPGVLTTDYVAFVYQSGSTSSPYAQNARYIQDPSGTPAFVAGVKAGINGRHSIGPFAFTTGSDSMKSIVVGAGDQYTADSEFGSIVFNGTLGANVGDEWTGVSAVNSFKYEHSADSCRTVTGSGVAYSAFPRSSNINTFPDGSGGSTVVTNSNINVLKFTPGIPEWGVRYASLGKSVFFNVGNAIYRDSFGNNLDILGMPKPVIKSATASSGGSLDEADYKYKAVFEKEDAQGNLYRSEPSDEFSVSTTSSNKTVTVLVHNMHDIKAGGTYRVALYRTEGGGNIFHKVQTINGTSASNLTVSFVDDIADSSVLAGAFLYTEGGELPSTRCPASFYVEAHRNRLFVISEDNRIFFSKEYQEGFGVSFTDTFFVPLDGLDDDKPTALGSAGGTIYLFRENSIWALSGDGPDKTGTGNYYTPQLVSNSIGALKGSPTIFTDEGLFFQSTKGIFLVGSGGITYVGSPVEDVLGTSRIIDMIQDQETSTIRFITDSNVIAYNYSTKQWSNYTFSTLGDYKIIGAGNADGDIYLSTNNSKLWKESGYKLGTTYLPLSLKTGWISFNEIQGFGRVYRFALLGKSKDKHTLTVKVYYNYDDNSTPDIYTFTTTSADDAVLQFRAHMKQQKCEAVKFEIYDADNSASTGDGFVIESIALEIGTKRGIFRTSESNTIGAN